MKYRNELLMGLGAYLYMISSVGCGLKWLIFIVAWLATGGTYQSYLLYHTLPRDLKLVYRGAKLLLYMFQAKFLDRNVIYMFRSVVKRFPNKVVFVNTIDNSEWTYKMVDEESNRVANFFMSKGFKKGDCVALYMSNRPEYIVTWMGMAKIGVTPALINYNLKTTSLVHTIKVAGCKALVYGLDLEDSIEEIKDQLLDGNNNEMNNNFTLIQSRSGSGLDAGVKSKIAGALDLDREVKKCSKSPEPEDIAKSIHAIDPLLYIYTSGTTGLPKAVIIKHIRQLFACAASHYTIGLSENDTIYCHLPLYHSSGGQVATASSLFFGARTIIRKKFSASNFWKDCVKYEVTGTQYIGEIARYLLAAPSTPEERQHKLRIMFGNGLRPQIWEKFTKRFNIPNIAEFYGATEGNSNIVNIDNKIGACGYISVTFPAFIQQRALPLNVIKIDQETKEPIRGPDGRCIVTDPGEPGEFVGKIVRGDPIKDFEGYKDKEATRKKVLADVFAEGDLYFRSGDVLVRDEFGYLYFKDRYGDTFRWKGENVSTTEVEANVSAVMELKDASSYGVVIPNTDGRAGMIAIPAQDNTEVDLVKLRSGLKTRIPAYAQPMFVRFVKEIDLTGTYKLKKNILQKEGFDLETTKGDPIFFLDVKADKYIPLDADLYAKIMEGKLRL